MKHEGYMTGADLFQEAAAMYRNAHVLLNSFTASTETASAREALASSVSANDMEMVTAAAFTEALLFLPVTLTMS